MNTTQFGQGLLRPRALDTKKALPDKAGDHIGRFREVISDPLNLLIRRHPMAGVIDSANHVTLHNGLKVPFSGPGAYYDAFSYILALNRGVHEPLEEYVFQEILQRLPPAPSMIELGAYWCHYSMWLKKLRPAATVVMVEPDPQNFAAGQANFAANGFTGEFIQAAVGPGEFEVDAFLETRDIKHLDVLHSDIQGAEVKMLANATRALERRAIDYLFISTHRNARHYQVVATLGTAGYRVEVSSDFENETTSFDGFVFASSPLVPALLPGFRPLYRKDLPVASPRQLIDSVSGLAADWQGGE